MCEICRYFCCPTACPAHGALRRGKSGARWEFEWNGGSRSAEVGTEGKNFTKDEEQNNKENRTIEKYQEREETNEGKIGF